MCILGYIIVPGGYLLVVAHLLIYDVFNTSGAAWVKEAIKNKYCSNKWFVKIELMLKVGICGGFTTFSTFAFESTGLMNQGNYFIAISYIILSVVLGVLAVLAGQYLN